MRLLTTFLLTATSPLLILAIKTEFTFALLKIQGTGLTYARMDPIVSPGQPSNHVHIIVGGNAFNTTMNDESTASATCSNTIIRNDKSNYWVPNLYFRSNNNFTSVPMLYMNIYYYFDQTDDDIRAFPRGLRIMSGDPTLRSPPSTGGRLNLDPNTGPIQPIQITCPADTNDSTPRWPANSDGLHGIGIQDPSSPASGVGFPNQNCNNRASPLRLDIHMPSCYNPAAGLDNYKHNTDWPSSQGATVGKNCPKGWIHVPHLLYEVYFDTPSFAAQWTPGQAQQPFVLSMGDPTGYGLHADFMAGWDEPTLQRIIDTCDAQFAGIASCPGVAGGLVSAAEAASCRIQPANPSEQVLGSMDKLPGCNPVVGSPGPAPLVRSC